jgi:hypothetical protein
LAAGVEKTMPDLAADMIIKDGPGLVNPDQAGDFYEAMHSYLVDVGITGVKVDVIHISVVYPCQFFFLWSFFSILTPFHHQHSTSSSLS